MGTSPSIIQYAIPISQKKEGQSPIYRNPNFKDQLLDGLTSDIKDVKKALLTSCKKHMERPCLGTIIRQEGQHDTIQYLSYKQLYEEAVYLGSGIFNLNLYFQPQYQKVKFIGIFSRNRKQWTILDFACILYSITTVPLYDTLGDQNISYVFDHTKMTTVFVNDVSLRALNRCSNLVDIKNIICFDPFNTKQQNYFKQKGIILIPYQTIINAGKQTPREQNSQLYQTKPNDCLTLCYTSGTTGPPKGAMLSHRNYCSFLGASVANKDVKFCDTDVVLSYLPLPHVLERQVLYAILATGGRIVYYSGDVQKIKDDLALVQPTVFVSVPRLFSRFFEVLKKKMGEKIGFQKMLIDRALSKKLVNVVSDGSFTHPIYDKIIFNQTKAALGGKVRVMISGSAPLLPQVHKFMKITMIAPLLQGYGQTQSTGASFITCAQDPRVGHVGGPVANIQYKLVDIPEMKYTSEDIDSYGNSIPRGEIWLRGPGVFLGYYKNDKQTRETLTEDGWLKTGDVGVILPNNKGLKIIDRKKNIFKLSQGQYVAAQKVQNCYLNCPLVQEIFLHGESTQSYAILFMVPVKRKLQQFANTFQIQQNCYQQLCTNLKIRIEVLKQLNEIGKKKGLKSFQMAKNIYLEPYGFQAKEILTNTMKVQRHQAKKVYLKQIHMMYKEGMLPIDKDKKGQ